MDLKNKSLLTKFLQFTQHNGYQILACVFSIHLINFRGKGVFYIAPVTKPYHILIFCTAMQHSIKWVPSGTKQIPRSGNSSVSVD